jgi:hypothetical protein
VRPHRPDTATGAEICRLLELNPDRVSSLGFELDAFGVTRVRVELLLDDALADRIAVALLASTTASERREAPEAASDALRGV